MNVVIGYIKDLAPVLIALLALYYSNRNVSKQIRKNSRVQWIESFRVTSCKLMISYTEMKLMNMKHSTAENIRIVNELNKEFINQLVYMKMLLDNNNSAHKELNDKLIKMLGENYSTVNLDEKDKRPLGDYFEKIIQQEQAKI